MNRVVKVILGVGLVSALAIGISIPVYQKINAKDLDVKGQEASVVDETGQNMPAMDAEQVDEEVKEVNEATKADE